MTRIFVSIALLLFSVAVQSQDQPNKRIKKSDVLSVEPVPDTVHDDDGFYFFIRNLEGKEKPNPEVEAIKKSYPQKSRVAGESTRESDDNEVTATPTIGQQYESNSFDGSYPPDNTIAVSTNGWVVSVVNSNVKYYDANGVEHYSHSIEYLLDDNSLSDWTFDPRVIYDSGSNRFILCELNGITTGDSQLILLFSKSENPLDGWNRYKIPISDALPGVWADFPSMGMSNNEVYVTMNMYDGSNQFSEGVIYQINKYNGYDNTSLGYQVWSGIADATIYNPFTIVPASYGHDGNYGPGVWLVASSSGQGDKIQVYHITNDIGASNEELVASHVSITPYQIGSNAVQPQGDELDIGDARMKSAFFLNNIIHCVFTYGTTTGYNGILYARINTSSMTVATKKFSISSTDLAYPSVASFSTHPGDPTVVVFYEESSATIYPRCRAVVCDHNMNFGAPIMIKDATAHIDVASSDEDYERWGDYTGISRKPGSSQVSVWVHGCYGRFFSNPFGTDNLYGNYIAELVGGFTGTEPTVSAKPQSTVYPNPSSVSSTLRFVSESNAVARIELYDVNGKLIKHLGNRQLHTGDYQLGFHTESLPSGVYFITVKTDDQTLVNEKLVVNK